MTRLATLLRGGLAAALALTACAPATPTPATDPSGTLPLTACQLSAPGLEARLAAECGTLTVPENPADPGGRQIGLHVAVVRARGRDPQPDPLFFLTGGPGQAATESYLQLSFAFDAINRERDIVLVDQRGTGGSNALRCPEPESEDVLETPADTAALAATCLAALDGDPRYYTTSLAMADLDQVRAALGYEQINIYGLSYGTRAALTYLRAYPAHVRTVILDGVVPPEEPLGLHVAADAQRALDLIFARCATTADCAAAFPDLPAEFAALAEQLRAAPAPVQVDDPITGEALAFDFTYLAFANAVRLLSYAPETVALLPLLIHTSYERNDFRLLAAQALLVGEQLSASISNGMGSAVLCSEDVPFITPEAAEAANAGTYLGDAQTSTLLATCGAWPAGDVPADFKQPVTADVPVLLLSGEADPVTPPAYGDQVAASLPNSRHLVAAGMGHNVIIRGCLSDLATDFIASADVNALDTSCVATIAPMPFFVTFSGPTP